MNFNLYNYLEPDEQIIWEGSPYLYEKKSYLHKSTFPFMIWLFFFLYITMMSRGMAGDWHLILYFFPFYAIGLWGTYGLIRYFIEEKSFNEWAKKGYVHYYVTNKKILTIIEKKDAPKTFYIELDKIMNLKIDYNIYGIGNLSSSVKIKASPYIDKSVCIKGIANVENVYKMVIPYINSAQGKMDNSKKENFLPHEIKWQGKEKALLFVPSKIRIMLFGFAFFALTLSVLIFIYRANPIFFSDPLMKVFMSGFPLMGIFFTLGVPYLESKQKQNHIYVITDDKIIIHRQIDIERHFSPAKDSHFFQAEDIQSLIVEINKKNYGNVLFDFKSKENIPKYRNSNANRFFGLTNPTLPYKLILQKKHFGTIKENVKDIENDTFILKNDIIEQTFLTGEKIVYKCSPKSLPTNKKNTIITYIVINFGVIISINSVNI